MILKRAQEDRLIRMLLSLADYTNLEKKIINHDMNQENVNFGNDFHKVLQYLWSNTAIIDEYVATNPDKLSSSDLRTIRDWKYALPGPFMLVKHQDGYSYFMKDQRAYAVVSISEELSSILEKTPMFVTTTLLPFEGSIVYDSIIIEAPITSTEWAKEHLMEEFERIDQSGEVYKSAQALIRNAEYHREEAHQRKQNQKIDEYNKQQRLSNPDAHMPAGMHKGKLANVSFEERERIIEGTVKLDEMLDYDLREDFDYVLKRLPKGKSDNSVEYAFQIATKDHLLDIAKALEIPQAYKLKKGELINQLMGSQELYRWMINDMYVFSNDNTLNLFEELVKRNGRVTRLQSDMRFDNYLPHNPPFIYNYKHDEYLTTVIPKEFMEILHTLDTRKLLTIRHTRRHIKDCARAAGFFYGIISIPDLHGIFSSRFPEEPISLEEFFFVLSDMIKGFELVSNFWFDLAEIHDHEENIAEEMLKNGYLVDMALSDSGSILFDDDELDAEDLYEDYEDDLSNPFWGPHQDDEEESVELEDEYQYLDEYMDAEEWRQELFERQAMIPRREITRDEIEGFFGLNYCKTIPEVQRLMQFIDCYIPDNRDDLTFANSVVFMLMDSAQREDMMHEILHLMSYEGFVFDSIDFANDFIGVYADALNAMPHWSNHGHTPAELARTTTGDFMLDIETI
jgi:hypothetical protein